jgi:hypothetical protein
MSTEPPGTGGESPRRVRKIWIVLATLVGVAILVRVALPYLIPWAVGWGAMRQAGLAAHLGNVDLWLLKGAIAVEDLRVAQGDDPPPDGQTPDPETALLALDKAYLDFEWLDLFKGVLHVKEIDLERPRVKLQRLANGRIDPLGQGPGPPGKRDEPETEPVPEPDPEAVVDPESEVAEEPEAAEEAGWPMVVDRLAIRGVEFHILDKLDGEELAALDLQELDLEEVRVHGTAFGLGGLAVTRPTIRVKRNFALDPTGGRSTEAPEGSSGAEDEAPTEGARTAFRVDDLDIKRAAFTLLVGEQTMNLALRVKADDVTLDPGATFPFSVGLEVEDGEVDVEGTAGALPPFFDGTVKWQNLPVPPLTLIARPAVQEGHWVKSCRAAGDLKVLARLGVIEGSGESPEVRASGTVQVSDVEISDPSGEEIHVAWKSFDADLREVAIPMGDAAATTPPRIAIGKVSFTEPSILYTQPSPALQELIAGARPEEDAATKEEGAEEEAPSEEPASAGPRPEITVDRFELRGGDVRFNDNAVEPPYRGVIEGLEVTAQGIDAMAPSADKVVVDAKLPGGARLDVDGKLGATDGDLRLDVKRMDLPTVNPYAAAAGVEVARGSLSLGADIQAKDAQWNIDSDVTLHHLRLDSEGSKSFVEKLDMPVDLILSVLRSPDGDIAIPVTVAFEEGKAGVDVMEIVMGALRQALVGAATIPLKALGGVFAGGGSVDFEPLHALPGAVQPGEGTEHRVADLVNLLEARPGLAVKLTGLAGDEDRPFLAEAELADQIAAGGDLPELPDGEGAGLLERGRIKGALKKRAEGEPLSLSKGNQVHLRRYLAQVEVPDERYDELGRDRARAAQRAILRTERIDASRVELADPGRGTPGVGFGFDAIPVRD